MHAHDDSLWFTHLCSRPLLFLKRSVAIEDWDLYSCTPGSLVTEVRVDMQTPNLLVGNGSVI